MKIKRKKHPVLTESDLQEFVDDLKGMEITILFEILQRTDPGLFPYDAKRKSGFPPEELATQVNITLATTEQTLNTLEQVTSSAEDAISALKDAQKLLKDIKKRTDQWETQLKLSVSPPSQNGIA